MSYLKFTISLFSSFPQIRNSSLRSEILVRKNWCKFCLLSVRDSRPGKTVQMTEAEVFSHYYIYTTTYIYYYIYILLHIHYYIYYYIYILLHGRYQYNSHPIYSNSSFSYSYTLTCYNPYQSIFLSAYIFAEISF